MQSDHYETLGIDESADAEAVNRAYRAKAAKAHPDAGGSVEEFQAVSEARTVLTDPRRRAQYDDERLLGEEGAALSKAFALFNAVLSAAEQQKVNVLEYDLVGDAIKTGHNEVGRLQGERAKLVERLAKTRRIAKKIKAKKGKKNLIGKMFEAQCRNEEDMLRRCDAEIDLTRRAIDILKDHKFDSDPPMAQMGGWASIQFG